VTPSEQTVKLELGEPEPEEAHLPEAHVGEGGVGVPPGLQPVRRRKGDKQKKATYEACDTRVHQSLRRSLRSQLFILNGVLGVGATRHPDDV